MVADTDVLRRAGLTLAEIGSLASRPFVGMEEEPSELERLCLEVRAHIEALSEEDDEYDDVDASSTDTDDECIMQAVHFSRETGGEAAVAGKASQDCSGSSRMSSGTLFNASGSYELSFQGSARLPGTATGESSRCGHQTSTHLPHICLTPNRFLAWHGMWSACYAALRLAPLLISGRTAGTLRFGCVCRMNSGDPGQLLHAHSSRSGEDLLFDLDEERHGHHGPEPTTPSAMPVSGKQEESCSHAAEHGFSYCLLFWQDRLGSVRFCCLTEGAKWWDQSLECFQCEDLQKADGRSRCR